MMTCARHKEQNKRKQLKRRDWAPEVRAVLNDFLRRYGNTSPDYDCRSYAVFDFDNTSSIFDTQQQTDYYQLCTMAYGFSPEQIRKVLATGLSDLTADRAAAGFGKGTYQDWIGDIADAYTELYGKYGPFTPAGLEEEAVKTVQEDPAWQEFSAKLAGMYATVCACESKTKALEWELAADTGMTEQEAYDLAGRALRMYRNVKTAEVRLNSPLFRDSRVGAVSISRVVGVSVTENIVELYEALKDNGIDVWVCSASLTDTIRAAVDEWGLHDSLTGLMALTFKKDKDGRYRNEYDYENGCAWTAKQGGVWIRDNLPSKALTQGIGKVTAIDNVLVPRYGKGPIAGFMDTTGDFNFCTEYSSLKLVCCFNRGDRKSTDGGGLIAEAAVYEKETLGYDLEAAAAAGDTLYILQGRDENGLRSFRPSAKTLVYGDPAEHLLADEDNEAQLQEMILRQMSIREIFERFSVKTEAADPRNSFGFSYGFLEEYGGYHCRQECRKEEGRPSESACGISAGRDRNGAVTE